MTREKAERELRYIFTPVYADEIINALSEPTIPLSVIEKIHNAVDNAEPDTYIENPLFYGYALTKEHVNEIIDKAVKECIHE